MVSHNHGWYTDLELSINFYLFVWQSTIVLNGIMPLLISYYGYACTHTHTTRSYTVLSRSSFTLHRARVTILNNIISPWWPSGGGRGRQLTMVLPSRLLSSRVASSKGKKRAVGRAWFWLLHALPPPLRSRFTCIHTCMYTCSPHESLERLSSFNRICYYSITYPKCLGGPLPAGIINMILLFNCGASEIHNMIGL